MLRQGSPVSWPEAARSLSAWRRARSCTLSGRCHRPSCGRVLLSCAAMEAAARALGWTGAVDGGHAPAAPV